MIQLPASVRILRGLLFAFAVLSFLNSNSVIGAESVGYEGLQRQSASAHAAGKRDEAIALMTRAIGLEPKQPRGYFLRARLYEEYRELDKAIADYDQVIKLDSRLPDAWQNRGSAHFKLGHIKESIADFDMVIGLRPDQAPHHWQRGISLYYAGRFEDGRKQFESHQTVNPDDVENAVWHFLCVTRASGLEKARAALLPIKGDTRVPMMEVHALFAGKLKPEDILKAAGEGELPAGRLNRQLFYAHLYLGLYFEAIGDEQKSREHISKAAGEHQTGDYMGDVARVHLQLRRPKKNSSANESR